MPDPGPDPGGVLGEIITRKRIDVRARLGTATLGELGARATRSTLSLSAALAQPGARFILEVKRASPSEGALADIDPGTVARGYRGAADAVSVLTDTPYFGGSLADLAAVRLAFDGPVLCKDFVIDPRQIAEARLHGADAVLVMLSVLDDVGARACLATAERLGMEALVEAHDEDEVRRAVALGARIIGINNRDLKTLRVDLATTEKLSRLVPADRILVSESGITTRADLTRLALHADAFLVGSSLMKSGDPAAAARALVFGRVKVCGLTNAEDIASARDNGASFAGLVLVPGTPRAVTPQAAERLAAEAEMPTVGVFRDDPVGKVATLARSMNFAAVQLHGKEDTQYINTLRRELPESCEVWAALPVGAAVPVAREGATRSLFDAGPGGTGRAFDWSLLAGRDDLGGGILAGGLTPANAAAAARIGTYALDLSSGIESRPGKKDAAKLQAFFAALRHPARADARLHALTADASVGVPDVTERRAEGFPCA